MANVFTVKIIAFVLLLPVLVSCNNDSGTVTPASGSLIGNVQLWDDKTSTLTDNSGVTVTVDDVAGASATTDASGRYTFDQLPYDIHNLTFTKSGYGTYKLFGLTHAASTTTTAPGTVIPSVQLGKVATTSVTSFSLVSSTYNGSTGLTYQVAVSPIPTPSNRAFIRYFLSTDPNVSNTNFKVASPVTSLLNNNAFVGFSKDDLLAMGFAAGQTVYMRIYGDSFQSNSYTDPNTGLRVFPNINPTTAPARSFVIP